MSDLPAHNLTVERALLCSVILNPSARAPCRALIRPRDLYASYHQRLWPVISRDDAPIDTAALSQALVDNGLLATDDDRSAIGSILSATAIPSLATDYAHIVRRLSAARQLTHVSHSVALALAGQAPLNGELETLRLALDDYEDAERATDPRTTPQDISRSVAELVLTDMPTQPAIISGLLDEQSIMILSGRPKAGKSYVALHLALCVATGRPFLGQYHVPTPSPVLYVALEDGHARLRLRLLRLLRGMQIEPVCSPPHLRYVANLGLRIDRQPHLDALRREINEHKPRLLILDTLSRSHAADENDRTAMTPVLDALQALRDEYHMAQLLVHHNRKEGQHGDWGSVVDRLRGSSSLAALADAIICMGTRSDNLTEMAYESKDFDPQQFRLIYTHDMTLDAITLGWQESQGRIDKAAHTDAVTKAVTTLLMSRPSVGRKDVADATNLSINTVAYILDGLVDAGRLSHSRGPHRSHIYRLTDQPPQKHPIEP